VIEQSLNAFGVKNARLTVVETDKNDAAGLRAWRDALIKNERSAKDIIVIHFVQDIITLAPGGPYPQHLDDRRIRCQEEARLDHGCRSRIVRAVLDNR
jgi:hypothetical protein